VTRVVFVVDPLQCAAYRPVGRVTLWSGSTLISAFRVDLTALIEMVLNFKSQVTHTGPDENIQGRYATGNVPALAGDAFTIGNVIGATASARDRGEGGVTTPAVVRSSEAMLNEVLGRDVRYRVRTLAPSAGFIPGGTTQVVAPGASLVIATSTFAKPVLAEMLSLEVSWLRTAGLGATTLGEFTLTCVSAESAVLPLTWQFAAGNANTENNVRLMWDSLDAQLLGRVHTVTVTFNNTTTGTITLFGPRVELRIAEFPRPSPDDLSVTVYEGVSASSVFKWSIGMDVLSEVPIGLSGGVNESLAPLSGADLATAVRLLPRV